MRTCKSTVESEPCCAASELLSSRIENLDSMLFEVKNGIGNEGVKTEEPVLSDEVSSHEGTEYMSTHVLHKECGPRVVGCGKSFS